MVRLIFYYLLAALSGFVALINMPDYAVTGSYTVLGVCFVLLAEITMIRQELQER